MLEIAFLFAFPALVAFGGAYDLLTMTIPNRISIALIVLFALAAVVTGLPGHDLLMHLAAGAAVLAFSFALFAFGGFGGGDAKLLAASALWIGLDHTVLFLAYVAVFGGILALAIVFYRRIPLTGQHAPAWALNLHQHGTGIPYGIAIASAALMIFPKTAWFATVVT